ncbi:MULTISPECIES: ABC transporter permease [Brevibacillus]|jgi:oligopeptide transport system permease protein|uniref:Oligopeptide ABC transporter permease n=1 Tax=Brevibacillus borstelensis AK1 TaxID=1300222 RepID=M8DE43_9BACL|nr:ABC transporter permease [Brevibacillus borstelensis]EMT54584.1 oligopeptide ABC transporter permease [Brevibacillus borstelensis AK1]KKX54318.1 peptide ABC transporter permease [Brevibacillus borstelensis cifa_chp40]MCC0563197.1 ABC transporter permease [Brevibacillus borstelensis]MCM3472785.1 ABC transporter permease [Brevibacillus borstelensis]MCM3557619.1 ABC transporter permease [Brevibacillus borstelensis]
MGAYLLKRVGYMLVTLFIIATATFFLMKTLPGTPFTNADRLNEQQLENMKAKYGLDQPVAIQYVRYLANLVQGDLGMSFKFMGRSVNEVIFERIGPSALIGFQALIVGTFVGLGLGVVSALRHNSIWDYTSVTLAVLGMSIPSFVFAALLQYYLGLKWGLLPPALWKGYEYTILPTLALSVTVIATVARFIRTEMLDVISQDYVMTARAKGLSETGVIVKHVLRNALIPVVTMLGPLAVNIMTGTLVIEKIFSVPGLGEQFTLSIVVNDYSVIMGITLFYSLLFILMVFVVDILYGLLDPRISVRGAKAK